MKEFLIAISLFFLIFLFGFQVAEKYAIDKCKEAGWEFIEKDIFPKRAIKESIFGEEYALKQLRYLQSSVATKCVVRFRR